MKEKRTMFLGILLIITATFLWGSTGVSGDYLINVRGLDSAWVTTFRTTCSGVIMLLILGIKRKQELLQIWKSRQAAVQVILFGIFGIACNYYFYLLTVELTNAPTATTLQYFSPCLIFLFTALKCHKRPSIREWIGILFALSGVFAIATHGNLQSLSITTTGLLAGLGSAMFLAFYNLFPTQLIETYGAMYSIAWAQFIAGILMNIVGCPLWELKLPQNERFDLLLLFGLGFQLIFGTIISYTIYLTGIAIVGPVKASILASMEPFMTVVIASILLHTPLVSFDYIGVTLITICILLFSVHKKSSVVMYKKNG